MCLAYDRPLDGYLWLPFIACVCSFAVNNPSRAVPCASLQEMEELKTSLRSKSDIDCLRKTLRQNYDRFISQGDGRVR